MNTPLLQLTRELRFALHESSQPTPPNSANGFAANPALTGSAPFLTLRATIAGPIDPHTDSQNRESSGRCHTPNGHGHNYELEVTLAGPPSPATGEILPIPLHQKIVNENILDHFDHKHLNLDCPEFQPKSSAPGEPA